MVGVYLSHTHFRVRIYGSTIYNVDLGSDGSVELFRINDWANLGSYAISGFSLGTWYTLTLRANGSMISVDVNGVTRITTTDATFTGGNAGVWSYNAASVGQHRFDSLSIQLLSGGQASKAGLANQASITKRLNGRLSKMIRRLLALEAPPPPHQVVNSTSQACVTGSPDISTNPNTLQIRYTNPSSGGRRLISLSVYWTDDNNTPALSTVSFGNASNKVWDVGGTNASPAVVNSNEWTGSDRLINAGALRPVQLNFASSIGVGKFYVFSTWDDNNDGNLCSAAPVTVDIPSSPAAPPSDQMWTMYYYASAQMIAVRKLTSTDNNLYFLHGDHLGSTSLTTDASGNVLSRQSYYPYGSVRSSTGTLPTLRTFTGQYTDSYIKLIHMGARWFDPELGRFVSADTIVPQPGNPQALNRVSYVINNPLRLTDPTGHDYLCNEANGCDDGGWTPTLSMFGISLAGEWSAKDIAAIYAAVNAVGSKLAKILGNNLTSAQAFKAGFGIETRPLALQINCPGCEEVGGETINSRLVEFSRLNGSRRDDWLLRGRNNVVHELGHVFNASWVNRYGDNHSPYTTLGDSMAGNVNLQRDGNVVGTYGFASPSDVFTWQMHGTGDDAGSANEVFADQFLGWTFDTWEGSPNALTVSASERATWMSSRMPNWINQMADPVSP